MGNRISTLRLARVSTLRYTSLSNSTSLCSEDNLDTRLRWFSLHILSTNPHRSETIAVNSIVPDISGVERGQCVFNPLQIHFNAMFSITELLLTCN